jgi:cytochrome c biogenesis protein CcmG, thiol:disulfide interchange protein DsbE
MTDRQTGDAAPSARASLWRLAPVLIFAALSGLFFYALMTGDPSKVPSALIGKPVPKASFAPLEGLVASGQTAPGFSEADLGTGDVSVVNFWASWCAPCVEEHPLLVELQKTTGVKLYGVNYKDQPEAARRFLGRFGNPFTAVGTDNAGRGAIEWGVYGMPETFVVGKDGRIAYKHVGPITQRSLAEKMIPAIEAAKAKATTPAP